mmetsp:Transcript_17550/g.30114  ORF Transcript_17550/g.30114 Transcript_17550/m.30114 type:complete len:209 (-) Transcript_17550:143-769(-)
MYRVRKRLWKSDLIVSLMKRLTAFGSLRAWFLNTTSSSHLRFMLKLTSCPRPKSGLPVINSFSFSLASSAACSFAFLRASSARSFLMRSNSAIKAASSSSSSLSSLLLASSPSDSSASAALGTKGLRASALPPSPAVGAASRNARSFFRSSSKSMPLLAAFRSLSSRSALISSRSLPRSSLGADCPTCLNFIVICPGMFFADIMRLAT